MKTPPTVSENAGRPEVFLTVVLPMFDEAKRIPESLPSIAGWLCQWNRSSEIIAVDDGSRDGTAETAGALLARHAGLPGIVATRVLREANNHGKGYAVCSGLLQARGRWILISDADEAAPISEVLKLLDAANKSGAAFAVGNRSHSEARTSSPWHRRILRDLLKTHLRRAGFPAVADPQCGFKLYHRDFADWVLRHSRETGYAFDLEHLLLAEQGGFGITETAIRWRHRPGGKVQVLRDGWQILRAAQRLKARFIVLPTR